MDIKYSLFDPPGVYKLMLWVDMCRSDLVPGQRYTLPEIIARQNWHDDDPACIEDARLFTWLVTKGRLPFTVAGVLSPRQNLFRYTPSEWLSGESTPVQHIEEES